MHKSIMKKYIVFFLFAVAALSATAQNFNVKAIVVYKTDGTQETVLLTKKASIAYSDFYGKVNPVDDDYIALSFDIAADNHVTYRITLSKEGRNAPYNTFGVLFSSSHIDSIPSDHFLPYSEGRMYYNFDKKMSYNVDMTNYLDRYNVECTLYPQSIEKNLAYSPGQAFYVRAFYVLDGKVYFSSEVEARMPKTVSAMRKTVYADYAAINDSVLLKFDASEIINNNLELFGNVSDYKQQLLLKYVSPLLAALDPVALTSMASKTEVCDDGMLYMINNVSSMVIDQALNTMNEEVSQPFYVQANLGNVFTDGSATATTFGTLKCVPTIIEADEKWGIRDNQYLFTSTDGQGTAAKPQLALAMNHLMHPGKVYDVTLTFAPNTQDETDTLNTYFYVCIADQTDSGTLPTLANSQSYGTDTIVSRRGLFIAKPQELKVMTMEYTPTNFTDMHVLQLCHQFSFLSAASRKKHGQHFRVVGVEVKPHEQ